MGEPQLKSPNSGSNDEVKGAVLPQNADEAKKKNEEAEIFDIGVEQSDFGKKNSLRYNALTLVLSENYDRAINELRTFLGSPSDYPNFKEKVTRYVNHSIDLIYAIKAKRNFPGIGSLTRAKQQELREKFKEHFKELRYILIRIENVEKNLKIEDARSTIYVIRTIWISALAIVGLWFMLEFFQGLAIPGTLLADDYFEKVLNAIFDKLGI